MASVGGNMEPEATPERKKKKSRRDNSRRLV
jgi:hypothetical protein